MRKSTFFFFFFFFLIFIFAFFEAIKFSTGAHTDKPQLEQALTLFGDLCNRINAAKVSKKKTDFFFFQNHSFQAEVDKRDRKVFLEQHAVSVTRALHVLKVYHGRTIKSCSVCDQPIWTLSKSYLRCYACGGKFHIACKAAASEAVCLQKRKFDLKSTIIVSEHFVKLADPSLPMGYILVTEAGVGLGVKREEDAVEIQAEIRWKDLTIEVDQGQGKSISLLANCGWKL